MKLYLVQIPTQVDLLEDIFTSIEVCDPFELKPTPTNKTVVFTDAQLAYRFALTLFAISVADSLDYKYTYDHHEGFNDVHTFFKVELNSTSGEPCRKVELKGFDGIMIEMQADGILFQDEHIAFNFGAHLMMQKGLIDDGDWNIL